MLGINKVLQFKSFPTTGLGCWLVRIACFGPIGLEESCLPELLYNGLSSTSRLFYSPFLAPLLFAHRWLSQDKIYILSQGEARSWHAIYHDWLHFFFLQTYTREDKDIYMPWRWKPGEQGLKQNAQFITQWPLLRISEWMSVSSADGPKLNIA